MIILKCSVTVQFPHLIVEVEDDKHVYYNVKSSITCHPKEHTLGNFELQTVRSGTFVLDLGSLNRILLDSQSAHIMPIIQGYATLH